jgi:hypothetical protein
MAEEDAARELDIRSAVLLVRLEQLPVLHVVGHDREVAVEVRVDKVGLSAVVGDPGDEEVGVGELAAAADAKRNPAQSFDDLGFWFIENLILYKIKIIKLNLLLLTL